MVQGLRRLLAPLLLLAMAACSAAPGATGPSATAPTRAEAPAVAPAASNAPAPLAPPVKVRYGRTIGSINMSYVAFDKGYWTDEGLDVEMPVLDSAARMIPHLAAGQLDLGVGATNAGLFNAYMRDVPLRLVADAAQQAPGQSITGLVVRQDLWDSGQIREVADLHGRTVAMPAKGTGTHVITSLTLERGGLKLDEVELVEMNFVDQLSAFGNKALDVGHQIEPLMTVGELQGLFRRWKMTDEVFPYHEDGLLIYGPSFSRDQPEAARRFMVGYLRGVRTYLESMRTPAGREEIIQILIKHGGPQERAIYDRITFPYVNPDGYVNRDSLAFDMDWFQANGFLQGQPDLQQMIDNQFVDYAIERLGRWRS